MRAPILALIFLSLSAQAQVPFANVPRASAGNYIVTSGGNTGFTKVFQITIDKTSCGAGITSAFPVALTFTHYYLTSNAGIVTSSSGYDIVFSSDAAASTLLPWEITNYDPTTGTLEAHVLSTCDNATSANNTFYMSIGKSSITSAQNTGSFAPSILWANYVAVYHLKDGTTLSAVDGSGNGFDGTLVNTPTAIAGQVDGAASFDGTTQSITVSPSTLHYNGNSVFAWITMPACAAADKYIWESIVADGGISFRTNNTNCKLAYEYYAAGFTKFKTQAATANLSTGTHLVGATLDGTTIKLYVDGSAVSMGTQGNTGTLNVDYTAGNAAIAWRVGDATATKHWTGMVDEVRLINKVLAPAEITATYNNQFSTSNIGLASFATIEPTVGYHVQSSLSQTQYVQANLPLINGDTNTITGYSPSGLIVGQCNDGTCVGNGGTQYHLALYSLHYDPVTSANTGVTLINTMSSFGLSNHSTTLIGEVGTYYWSSYSPFYISTNLYLPIFRRGSVDNNPYAAGLIISPDDGLHWCNYTNYLIGGNAGPNSCDAGNWAADGDAPTNITGLQWPVGADGTKTQKFAQWIYVQECQASNINCPVTPINNDYIYFLATYMDGSVNAGSGTHRLLKSANPMLIASYGHWTGSVWSADYTLTGKTYDSAVGGQAIHGIMWSIEYQAYLGFGEDDAKAHINKIFASKDLKAWGYFTTLTNSAIYAEWFCPVLALSRTDSSNRKYVVVSNDDQSSGFSTAYTLVVQDLNLGINH